MSKFGLLSFLMAAVSFATFYIMRGPNADIYAVIKLLSIFSIIGLIFAAFSKNKWWLIAGMVLNLAGLSVAFLLLLAMGISEP